MKLKQCKILDGKHKGRDHVGGIGVEKSVILKWRWGVNWWTVQSLPRVISGDGNEPLGLLK
jgi:hypothetical protein